MNIILLLLFVGTAFGFGYCKFIADGVQFKYSELYYVHRFINFGSKFWSPEISWRNKWKNGYKHQGEKFWGSSRWFVWTTDAWHLFTMLQYFLIFIAVIVLCLCDLSIFKIILSWFLWWCIGLAFFEIKFSKL